MDQGLKERLVGAAVLVAIGVWLIPWVLDGPEAPLETTANSLQLPAAEEPMPMRTQTLKLGDEGERAAEHSDARDAAAGRAGRASPNDAPAATPETTFATTAPAPPRPRSRRRSTTRARADSRRWIQARGRHTAEARRDRGRRTASGSCSSARSARKPMRGRIAQRASTFGYKADVSSYRANGRTLYRVRVGSATSRGQADATASALRAHGLSDAKVRGRGT